jgi:TPR repeat protein
MLRIPAGRQSYEDGLRELAHCNLARARALISAAAKLEYLPAIAIYALMLEHGIGGRASMAKAVVWLKRAAKAGESASALRLAAWFIENRNYAEAKHSLRSVYRDPRAALLLTQLYSKSRSCRASRRAKAMLVHAGSMQHLGVFGEDEQEAYQVLFQEFRKRNPTFDADFRRVRSARGRNSNGSNSAIAR